MTINVNCINYLRAPILLHLDVVSVDVLGGVSVQTVDDELVWVQRRHQRVCCLKEIHDCLVRKFTTLSKAIFVKVLVQYPILGWK